MLKTILVPLDGTSFAAAALPLARALARVPGSRLHLLWVVEPLSQTAADAAATYLNELADELRDGGQAVETLVRAGDPASEILKLGRTLEVDVIVMATHARGSRSIAALTSVARRVLTESQVPVLLVRPGGVPTERIHTLLVPVDGQPGGSLALAAAIVLARQTQARLVLLHVVVPLPARALPALPLGIHIDPVWEDYARAAGQMFVELVARRLNEAAIITEARVTTGEVAYEIDACAQAVEADVVVMSTHAMVWPGQAYAGSVADGVVANSRRPVLLVKREPPAGEAQYATSQQTASSVAPGRQ